MPPTMRAEPGSGFLRSAQPLPGGPLLSDGRSSLSFDAKGPSLKPLLLTPLAPVSAVAVAVVVSLTPVLKPMPRPGKPRVDVPAARPIPPMPGKPGRPGIKLVPMVPTLLPPPWENLQRSPRVQIPRRKSPQSSSLVLTAVGVPRATKVPCSISLSFTDSRPGGFRAVAKISKRVRMSSWKVAVRRVMASVRRVRMRSSRLNRVTRFVISACITPTSAGGPDAGDVELMAGTPGRSCENLHASPRVQTPRIKSPQCSALRPTLLMPKVPALISRIFTESKPGGCLAPAST
mmetsp:Transcript_29316/g.85052  ORF Transcript_29316/g.85052 Transcript_29316/m.85052 type:complete len:290 (+) Transcript_29316:414-1283(+)